MVNRCNSIQIDTGSSGRLPDAVIRLSNLGDRIIHHSLGAGESRADQKLEQISASEISHCRPVESFPLLSDSVHGLRSVASTGSATHQLHLGNYSYYPVDLYSETEDLCKGYYRGAGMLFRSRGDLFAGQSDRDSNFSDSGRRTGPAEHHNLGQLLDL